MGKKGSKTQLCYTSGTNTPCLCYRRCAQNHDSKKPRTTGRTVVRCEPSMGPARAGETAFFLTLPKPGGSHFWTSIFSAGFSASLVFAPYTIPQTLYLRRLNTLFTTAELQQTDLFFELRRIFICREKQHLS